METEYLTQEKFGELEKELEFLRTVKRKEVAQNLEYAKSLGDLSENQEYQEARDAQAILEDRIKRLEMILKSASIVSTHDSGIVSVGSVVTLLKEIDNSRKDYNIVGSEEANAALGKISMKSPLGSVLLGKSKGETFSFSTPAGGIMSYKIIDIK
ncbi:MAG TPA: transcription elongation factor GreA [Candidatus Paceibacterota bacterium]